MIPDFISVLFSMIINHTIKISATPLGTTSFSVADIARILIRWFGACIGFNQSTTNAFDVLGSGQAQQKPATGCCRSMMFSLEAIFLSSTRNAALITVLNHSNII